MRLAAEQLKRGTASRRTSAGPDLPHSFRRARL